MPSSTNSTLVSMKEFMFHLFFVMSFGLDKPFPALGVSHRLPFVICSQVSLKGHVFNRNKEYKDCGVSWLLLKRKKNKTNKQTKLGKKNDEFRVLIPSSRSREYIESSHSIPKWLRFLIINPKSNPAGG